MNGLKIGKDRRENEHLHHFDGVALINFILANGFEYMSLTNVEDVIRKSVDNNKNILTGIFRKVKYV